MLKQEFESRVKVEVSAEEYAAIETVYMNSDLDKDAFCKMWKRINKQHIAELKAAEAAQQAKEEMNNELLEVRRHLYNIDLSGQRFYPCYLTERDVLALRAVGINPNQNLFGILADIDEYFKAA